VASNLFGDILTDLGSALQGSLGLGASGNINPERAWPSVFEPIHGSAPDIAGKGVAHPLGAILSAAMLLRQVGDSDGASRIEAAVAQVCAGRQVLTRDLGGTATTGEVGDAVVMAIASNEMELGGLQ
jgi:tartrate dehydrogenase/decarboxylase/D-malate dehydrogenase